MGNTLHVLALFCASRPALLLPHIEVLSHFLKHEHATKAVQHTCEMLPKLLRILDHPPRMLLTNLETYLAALVFRVPESLLQHAVPALCMTITASCNSSLLISILAKFHKYLERFEACVRRALAAAAAPGGIGTTDLAEGALSEPVLELAKSERLSVPSVYRAMLCVGMLCRHYDFEPHAQPAPAAGGGSVLVRGDVHAKVHRILLSLARVGLPHQTVLYAYKGLGQLCVRSPDLLVSCHSLFVTAAATLDLGEIYL